MEQVLVIPTKAYTDSVIDLGDLKDVVCTHGQFMDRPLAESNPDWLQIIPYIIVINGKMDDPYAGIFTYKRLKGGSEARLHAKSSIGLGGHVNTSDLVPNQDLWSAVEACAYRELTEELQMPDSKTWFIDFKPVIIYDPSNDVGKVHLGVVGICEVHTNSIKPAEKEKIEGSFIARHKVASMSENMETWSKIAIERGVI